VLAGIEKTLPVIYPIDATHDARLKSWVESAGDPQSDFPIQNLPFGIFRSVAGENTVGVRIGAHILDLSRARVALPLPASTADVLSDQSLNRLMQLQLPARRQLRAVLSEALRADAPGWQDRRAALRPYLLPVEQAQMQVPAVIGDYTDFYASIHHARNLGRLFRPDNPLLPNYKYVPIAYHGRASSIVVSGATIIRPYGQIKLPASPAPVYQPAGRLDYELELGCYIARGNPLGSPVSIDLAEEHLFGFSLLNDWSARDIQAWESQPLGPFLAKSFATTVSPWIVTLEALAPFRAPAAPRGDDDPPPLDYLDSHENRKSGAFDIYLEVFIHTARMRQAGIAPLLLSRGSARGLYWTPAQFVAHHTSNGCNLRAGDLLASGTISGPGPHEAGCLLELTAGGSQPILLPTGETRTFLDSGDEIIMTGYCLRDGFARIGFGECRGRIAPALMPPHQA
jgi:fumarylacetoacetase